jgi:methionyl-tRNA synthetase
MSDTKEIVVSVAAIGQTLMEHSKSADLDGKRGLVVELFPFIFGAHERMSARAISRFLKEKHGVKLSAVTITKALNDPKKYWNQFFDTIEPYVKAYENWDKSAKREKFLFDDNGFKVTHFPGRELLRKHLLKYEFAQAINVLREKWFSIDYETRMKAGPYLAERLLGKVK